jgi:uncharacterized protein (DUF736 family)
MAIIGNFSGSENGYMGVIRTQTIRARAQIRPVTKPSEKAPDYLVYANNAELGAGWRRESREDGKPYVSLKLDDPSFAGPIYCSLVSTDKDGEYDLIWVRQS